MDRLDQILHICKVIANKYGEPIAAIGNEARDELEAMFDEAGIEKSAIRDGMTVDSEYLWLAEDRMMMLLENCLSFAIRMGWSAKEYLELNHGI